MRTGQTGDPEDGRSAVVAETTPRATGLTVRWADRSWVFESEREVSIGRLPGCDIWIDDPEVSRRHAVLRRTGSSWTFADEGSANGTFQNGIAVGEVPVDREVALRLSDPDNGPQLILTPAAPALSGPVVPAWEALSVLAAPPTSTVLPDGPATEKLRTFTIGRGTDSSVPIDDPLASRVHARIRLGGGVAEVEDLESLNGTFVNGVRIRRVELVIGDVISVGNHDFLFDGTTLVARDATRRAVNGLSVRGVDLVLPGGKKLLAGVDLDAPRGTLTAVIGPSGAGKSTLSGVITGNSRPTAGAVLFDGLDVHSRSDQLRTRIGFVPQADVVHGGLSVTQALDYAARLRLPDDTSESERMVRVRAVIAELGLTEHAETRIDRLSGGQRKRASVALELLTEPSLLVLDEPTSGLDPALDQQVMSTLRGLADRGRAVLVVTHSVAHLDVCDQILLLAAGGRAAYLGPPATLLAGLQVDSWPAAFAAAAADADGAHRRYLSAGHEFEPVVSIQDDDAGVGAASPSGFRQGVTIASRQLRLIAADRAYAVFLAVLPLVLSALALIVEVSGGFAGPSPDNPTAASQLLVILIVGASFMGAALTVRDLVGERQIYRRERAVGLSPRAYLAAKVVIYGGVSILESLLFVGVVVSQTTLSGHAVVTSFLDLLIPVALTTWCCACIGLWISAFVRSAEQVMPVLVVFIMLQLVLCGGVVDISGRVVLDQLSWLMPARWGYAAVGAAVDIRFLNPVAADDVLWRPESGAFLLALGASVALAAVAVLATLRLIGTRRSRRRAQTA